MCHVVLQPKLDIGMWERTDEDYPYSLYKYDLLHGTAEDDVEGDGGGRDEQILNILKDLNML